MGNCFGKPSSSAFSSPGRTLGDSTSAPASDPNARATIPARNTQSQSQSVGRTLGTGGDGAQDDPRTAAARAAEVGDDSSSDDGEMKRRKRIRRRGGNGRLVMSERANKNQGKGALGKKLDAQRQQTRTDTLEEVSRENRRVRDADAQAQTRNWD
ncbi:MAG: hypothetical protein M1820_002374 [Bogoriella megaspora]|nr:MAG: hypothetical protein M1820_002374 [Bogoriella megaspora]